MQHLHLQTAFQFTPEDLKINRDGQLSAAQAQRYAVQAPKVSKLALIVVAVHALLIGGILGAIALATGKTALWIVLGIVLMLGLVPFVFMQNEANINPTLRGDLAKGRVQQACGIAILKEQRGRNNSIKYQVYVDGVTLALTSKQASAFIHEERYCVYYLPLSLTLLSAEPMRD